MACKYGIERGNCRAANAALKQLGEARLDCRDCKLDAVVDSLTSKYGTSPKSDRRVGRWARKMDLPSTLLGRRPSFQTGFRCPVIKEPISAPCALEKCGYHIDYPWAANCLLAYLHQQGVESLSAEEIAYLYQQPIEYVKQLIDDAISKLRSSAIDVQSTDDTDLSPQFRYFVTDRVCIVCESEADFDDLPPRNLTIPSIGAVYCSKECRDEKPPRLVELEVEKGIPVNQILDWTFTRYKTLTLAEQALGIPRWMIYDACQRFISKPIDDYFPTLKVPGRRRNMLIRRSWKPPSWLGTMVAKARPVSAEVRRKFGPVTVTTQKLKDQLVHLMTNL